MRRKMIYFTNGLAQEIRDQNKKLPKLNLITVDLCSFTKDQVCCRKTADILPGKKGRRNNLTISKNIY